jgi:uncharacterized protein
MKNKNLFLAAAFALALLGMAIRLYAMEIPALAGRVNDLADVLTTDTRAGLESALADLERTDSTQVVVLTMKSIEEEPIEEFGIRLAEQWKIGQKGLDNGAILILALAERKVRIEVGRGLEGKLTDLMAGRIIRNEIIPRFREGDFDGGVRAGVNAIIATVKGEYTATGEERTDDSNVGEFPSFLIMAALIIVTSALGGVSKILGGVSGAIGLPIAVMVLVGGITLAVGIFFAVLGFFLGLLISVMAKGTGGGISGGGFGGSGSYGGGFSSGGGFSGGGGGASGSW